jgi:hypothetical protein
MTAENRSSSSEGGASPEAGCRTWRKLRRTRSGVHFGPRRTSDHRYPRTRGRNRSNRLRHGWIRSPNLAHTYDELIY